jgi:putative methylase
LYLGPVVATMGKRALARKLGTVRGFENPQAAREQYQTPSELAAHLVHTAGLHGDIEGRSVVDLGCGTGILALGAALAGADKVVGLDIDPAALTTAAANEAKIQPSCPVAWVLGDATRPPLCPPGDVTVLMNPPFGAQTGNEHADRAFLDTAAGIAAVSYSIHNAGSKSFVESFVADNGGAVTHAFEAAFDLPATFEFHSEATRTIDTELFRVEW